MKLFITSIIILYCSITFAAAQSSRTFSEEEKKALNWYNLDPVKDKTWGAGIDKAYKDFLTGKKCNKIVVAVIDGGVDINHEDLKGKMWINKKEIPGNSIDDDKNGFIDDIHGWNFLGNSKGENIDYETLEVTRLFKKYSDIVKQANTMGTVPENLPDMALLKKIDEVFRDEFEKAKKDYDDITQFNMVYHIADSLISKYLNKNDYTADDVKSINTSDERIAASKRFLLGAINSGFSKESHKELTLDMTEKYLYHLNLEFNPREIIGDDPETNTDSLYGNNDVAGPRADHGTFVAGIIAAVRNNNIGCDGIADNAEIMALRVVPNGDERDKDVANAIRYAVDNGAKIINLSFGKDFSPQKNLVDKALIYAGQKNVLVVHAAGNEGDNNDVEIRYPTNRDSQNKPLLQSWLDVGASSMKKGKNFPGFFSNYGKASVELFAPGVDILSLTPGNKYGVKSGTSFAAPVVSGIAALIMGAYPDLSAAEVRDILLQSVQKYKKKVYLPGIKVNKRKKVKFENLSVTGGVANAWNALKMAESYKKK